MKKKATRLLALILCVIMLAAVFAMPLAAAGSSTGGASNSMADVSEILNALSYAEYSEMYAKKESGTDTITIPATDYNKDKTNAEVKDQGEYLGKTGGLYVPEKGSVTWNFDIPKEGKYVIEIEYCQYGEKTNSIERIFYINGSVPFSEARSIVLSKVWEYQYTEDGKFEQDTNGNDIRPDVEASPEWISYKLKDSNGFYINPFEFYFKDGENSITLESVREPMIIRQIKICPQEELISYEDYLKEHGNKAPVSGDAVIKIEAENPSKVSNVTMYPVSDRTSSITSGLTGNQSAQVTKYNTVGREQWQTVGEWMLYDNIYVEEDGYYTIVVRYKQDLLSGMYVSRKIYIDGQVPFAEAGDCRFPFTDTWKTTALNDGETEFKFYLTKGYHSIKLEAVLDSEMALVVQKVSDTLANINSCYLEILKLTGSDPDANRTYNFSRVMPDVLKTMVIEAANLEDVYNFLKNTVKEKGEQAATIEQIYILLRKMGTDETQIPTNLASLKSQIGSLGTWINSAKTQPLQVDYIQIQSTEASMPKGEAGFFPALWYELQLFWYSFFIDYNSLGAMTEEAKDNAVEVWVTTGAAAGRDEAQIIRNLAENNFTPDTNIGVNLQLVSGGTLLPSVLAGVGPDVSLMESSTTIIDYALRNAVTPLNKFMSSDKNADYNVQLTEAEKKNSIMSAFPDAAMIPVTLYTCSIDDALAAENPDEYKGEEFYYALPDSLSFSMLFYRKDVLSSLELEIPKTWDDLLSILPVLQYNNMEIGIQNDIYTFITQSNNEVYADYGMRINFDNEGVLNAFTKLCNMYTQYSLPYTYDFSNRFRTGEMPIGIAAYTTCNQLAIFASELSGLWAFTELPGEYVKDENGNYVDADGDGEYDINNKAMASVTGCIMLTGCKNEENAWEFMKWYTSADFQIPYSNDIVSIKGIAARPATANIEALMELPWTNEEAENILLQFGNLDAVENYPGSYYLARYIDFAFLAAYNERKDPADSLLDYVNTINKEINRKREEFGMDTLPLGVTLNDLRENPELRNQ